MTEPERSRLRLLIDRAKRERLRRTGYQYCGYCGEPFERTNWKQAYCTPSHRKYAWRQTPQGREFENAASRRRHARDRVAA